MNFFKKEKDMKNIVYAYLLKIYCSTTRVAGYDP